MTDREAAAAAGTSSPPPDAREAVSSRDERRRQGEAARARVPPEKHAEWIPAADRPDPIALLEEQAVIRLPDLVPLRHARMAISPLTFLRGAALPMAADLSTTPNSGIVVQLGGDSHLSNFGLFASPERDLLFDINDFDESLPGPWEWDVKRLAASTVVAGRVLGLVPHDARHTAVAAVRSYQSHMAEYASMRAIEVFYSRVDASEITASVAKGARAYVMTTLKSSAHHDALHELPKLTEVGEDGQRRIIDRPPTTFHHPQITNEVEAQFVRAYAETLQEDRRTLIGRYAYVDAAIKVVGVGSVGLFAGAILLDGGDGQDPIFLQLKQAEASVLERFLGPSSYPHHGQRVVAGQRLLQAASDVLLGWTTGPQGRHYYVRQLQDQKAGAVIEQMTLSDLTQWAELCGWSLARGHARSGDPVVIAAYVGEDDTFAHAIADFAVAYADQTERDHAALLAAIKSGRIPAQSDT
jgi:uncharacterized protein (DUF2252 family)